LYFIRAVDFSTLQRSVIRNLSALLSSLFDCKLLKNHPMDAQRKGARSISEIPKSTIEALNRGEIASANLVEWLAIDQVKLVEYVLQSNDLSQWFPEVSERVAQLKKPTVNTIGKAIGEAFAQRFASGQQLDVLQRLSEHPADAVRIWMAYCTSLLPAENLDTRLQAMRGFAADSHFGVREIAWMAMRPFIAAELNLALQLLSPWVYDDNEAIRRFATEATRPRGVWCAHIDALKTRPELAQHLLDPLVEDSSKYVRDSVANWLNDASKTRPDFVRAKCAAWQERYTSEAAAYTCRRALRTLHKSES
jgi:3-methyladenine DNA glycosylase AlkC